MHDRQQFKCLKENMCYLLPYLEKIYFREKKGFYKKKNEKEIAGICNNSAIVINPQPIFIDNRSGKIVPVLGGGLRFCKLLLL